MKINKEYIKQSCLIMFGIALIGIGYLNHSLDYNTQIKEVSANDAEEVDFNEMVNSLEVIYSRMNLPQIES